MTDINIKYRNGTYTFKSLSHSHNFSASQAKQLLEQIQPEIRKNFGFYTWTLEGNTFDGYKVVAHYGKIQLSNGESKYKSFSFCDSHAKTPKQALVQSNAVKYTLKSLNLL